MLKKVKFFNSDTGQWEIVAVAEKGDKGDKGDQGPQGEVGPQGKDGVQSDSISKIEVVDKLPDEGEWIEGVLYIVVVGEGGE